MNEIDKKASEYKKLHKPKSSRVSKLDRFTELVLSFHHDNYSYKQIADFLGSAGLSVSKETIGRFIKKHTLKRKVNRRSDPTPTDYQDKVDHASNGRVNPLSKISELPKKNFIYDPKK